MLTDCHTHILPNLDDGSKNVETSVIMINELKSQGVRMIFLTPHYYADFCSIEDFVEARTQAFSALTAEFNDPEIRFVLASETYLSKDLFNNSDISGLLIGDTNCILTELEYTDNLQSQIENIQKLISKYSVTPIIAHLDRYPEIFLNKNNFKAFRELGCLVQINTSVFVKPFYYRNAFVKYLHNGEIDFLGTDCHNMTSRKPQFDRAVDYLQKNADYVDYSPLFDNALDILAKRSRHKLFI